MHFSPGTETADIKESTKFTLFLATAGYIPYFLDELVFSILSHRATEPWKSLGWKGPLRSLHSNLSAKGRESFPRPGYSQPLQTWF